MRLLLHGMIGIGMAGGAFAEPAGQPPVAPPLSRVSVLSDPVGAHGGGIYLGCPAGPAVGDAAWRGCARGSARIDHGPAHPAAVCR